VISVLFLLAGVQTSAEADFYRIVTPQISDEYVLEVGGLANYGTDQVLVSTRRGEVLLLDGVLGDGPVAVQRFASGLQEPLGLSVQPEGVYVVQRGELSLMVDADEDGVADVIRTICDDWEISGNYHEYNFGPRLAEDGSLWITTNKPFGDEPFGRKAWRGFALRVKPGEAFEPVACGLRSPAGIERSPWGEMFYTDNQGEWCGASKLSALRPGSFHGHPWGIFACELPQWTFDVPPEPESGTLMPDVQQTIPSFELPAVWFPSDKMGQSPAGMAWDQTDGRFGPFAGQLFVGDQHHSSVMRIDLEQVGGRYQGACFPFRAGFSSGIVRVRFAPDGSLLVGLTNRGWGSKGNRTEGLQRLVWRGGTPFELLNMRVRDDGFELRFTQPLDPSAAGDPASYRFESYTYLLHSSYGSEEVEREELSVTSATLGADGRSVRLVLPGLRRGYVHELHADGVRSRDGEALLHQDAYYTLVHLPGD